METVSNISQMMTDMEASNHPRNYIDNRQHKRSYNPNVNYQYNNYSENDSEEGEGGRS